MSQIHPTVREVLDCKAKRALKFEDGGRYDAEMADAYSRTVGDVEQRGHFAGID